MAVLINNIFFSRILSADELEDDLTGVAWCWFWFNVISLYLVLSQTCMYFDYNVFLCLCLSGRWENSTVIVYALVYFVATNCQQRRSVSYCDSSARNYFEQMDATLIPNERNTTPRKVNEYVPTVRRNVGWPRNRWRQTSLKVEQVWMAYNLLWLLLMMIKIIKSYPAYCWYILNVKFRRRSSSIWGSSGATWNIRKS